MVKIQPSTQLTRAREPLLPLDVCGIIIDILAADEHDPYLLSVKECFLVSRAFLPLCRKHIFATITIHDRSNLEA